MEGRHNKALHIGQWIALPSDVSKMCSLSPFVGKVRTVRILAVS